MYYIFYRETLCEHCDCAAIHVFSNFGWYKTASIYCLYSFIFLIIVIIIIIIHFYVDRTDVAKSDCTCPSLHVHRLYTSTACIVTTSDPVHVPE